MKRSSSKLLDEFNASIMFDKELYSEDIDGSIAHVKMLQKQGIIPKKSEENIIEGLLKIKDEIEKDEYILI